MTNLISAIVRILNLNGDTTGTGFVLTGDGLIITCAHVVESAGSGPSDTVRLVFHLTGDEVTATVEPDGWRAPETEDIAILRLDGILPPGVIPLPLGRSDGTANHPFETFGFPDANPVGGLVGGGQILGQTTLNGVRVLQLRSQEVTGGFSGAPVWDFVTRRVVGMVTSTANLDSRGRLAETAFITPTETLLQACPDLQLTHICPYHGLAAFTETDAEFFFGREALVADLVTHLRQNPRFLAVVGPSGSGKSSVIQAGLFPALRRGEVSGSESWHILSFRPGENPFAALTDAGLEFSDEVQLSTVAHDFLNHHLDIRRLVLYIDQFEELFALCSEPMQTQFIHELADLLNSSTPATVILTIRADFYGQILRYAALGEQLSVGQVNILPMRSTELQAAIEKPAKQVGLQFEPGLVETIAAEARQAEHPLPLLEASLTRLWEQQTDSLLTHDAYQQVGRVTGAIGQWANDMYSALDPTEKRLTQYIFTRLVHYGEGEIVDTRRRLPLEALITHPEEEESTHRLVQRLANARLLVTDRDERTGAETIEIIHDALLREWGQLRGWLKDQHEFYLWRQRLDERQCDWEDNKGDLLRGAALTEATEKLSKHFADLNQSERVYIQRSLALQRRINVGITAIVVFVLAMLAVFAWVQHNQAITQSDLAGTAIAAEATSNARRQESDYARATAEAAQVEAEVRRIEVEEQQKETAQQRQVAVARQLATQAELALDNFTQGQTRSLLLAIESLQMTPTFEGDRILRRGLDLMPVLQGVLAYRLLGPIRVALDHLSLLPER